MFNRLAAGLLAGASLAALAAPAEAGTTRPVRWNTGGAVWTTTSSEFKTFLSTGEVTDRALDSGISNSGWTAEEIQEGMTKTYAVDINGVSRFLYSDDGVKFLKDQTRSYFPYWKMKSTSVVALRSAIIADSIDGEISSAGIMGELPVDFRLADTCGTYDGIQNVCAQTIGKARLSAPRCSPGTGSCPPAFRPTPRCLSRHLASLPPVPSGDQLLSSVPQPRLRTGFFMACLARQ